MTDRAKSKAQLITELAALRRRVSDLEAEQQQREAELADWLAAERENWALAEALNQTGAAISSTLRGEEVLDRILDEMSRVIACDAACLLLVEGEIARVYRWRGYIRSGWATPYEIVSATLVIDNIPILRSVRTTGRPVVVPQADNLEAWVNKFGTVWVKSYACAPIRSRGRVIGFLTVDSETPGFFEPADKEPLQSFADQAAIALENVGLHDRMRHEIGKRLKMLKQERNFISAILNTADALVIALNRTGQIVHFNRACEQVSGYAFAEVKNHYAWELMPPDSVASAQVYFTELPAGHSSERSRQLPGKFEAHLLTKTGQRRLIAWSTATLFDKNGAVEHIIATGIDITEQKQAEVALRESEERFKVLFEFAPDAYYLNDLEGRFIDGNRTAQEVIGYPKEALIGRSFLELGLLTAEETPKALAALAQNRRGEASGPDEFTLNRKDGSQITVEIRSFPIEIRGQKVVLGLARDISKRKQAEEALHYSQATQRAILDAIPDFMFRISRSGVYIPFHTPSQSTLSLPGQSESKKIIDVLPENLARQVVERLEQIFETGEMQIFEYSLGGPGEIRHYEARLISSGIDEVLCILRDITSRKQAEEALRAQNEQLQARNRELDAFAHTVAHDLKNPIGVLTNVAEILLEDYAHIPIHRLGEYLQSIAQSGRRANRIVDGLLLLAGLRQQTVDLRPLEMDEIVAEALQRLEAMITKYQAEVVVPAAWPVALGYAPWVEEIWENYLSNGLKYGGRPPRLELGATTQEDRMVRFWIKDNGAGLTPAAQARLFTEFTQLEPERMEGHGLGLSIVRRIVEKLGGQVGIESEGKPGQGSTFSFTLPAAPV